MLGLRHKLGAFRDRAVKGALFSEQFSNLGHFTLWKERENVLLPPIGIKHGGTAALTDFPQNPSVNFVES